jgi:hypothetical protein
MVFTSTNIPVWKSPTDGRNDTVIYLSIFMHLAVSHPRQVNYAALTLEHMMQFGQEQSILGAATITLWGRKIPKFPLMITLGPNLQSNE